VAASGIEGSSGADGERHALVCSWLLRYSAIFAVSALNRFDHGGPDPNRPVTQCAV
jgi:hypothetical protein